MPLSGYDAIKIGIPPFCESLIIGWSVVAI